MAATISCPPSPQPNAAEDETASRAASPHATRLVFTSSPSTSPRSLRFHPVVVQLAHHRQVSSDRANPQAIRIAALALPQPGTVELQHKTPRVEMPPDWLQQVRGLVFAAELTNRQATHVRLAQP